MQIPVTVFVSVFIVCVGDFHLPSIPWIPQGRRAPGGRGTGKDRLAHPVLTRSDWRMLPFSLAVQVTLSNINGTLRVYS